jgi:Transposase DDE domain group 1
VRQLDRVLGETLRRAWAAGGGPGDERLVVDLDSFIGEVHGHAKQGAGYGYTRKLGYHPLVAARGDTGEVLHVRQRKGQANTQRGALRSVDELLARVRRAGASGEILVRADAGFWNKKVFARLRERGCQYSIGTTMHPVARAAIEQIADDAWEPVVNYPDTAICELAETTLSGERLIVRRVHVLDPGPQGALFAYGNTSRSSPTAPTICTSSTQSTASTPSSSSSSATSKTRHSRTSPPASSAPTAPGRSSPAWPTTCTAGPPSSACATAPRAPRRPSAAACSPCPAD